ncbi:MAG: hypothetical protein RR332_01090, partial [Clostridiales bacterium]
LSQKTLPATVVWPQLGQIISNHPFTLFLGKNLSYIIYRNNTLCKNIRRKTLLYPFSDRQATVLVLSAGDKRIAQ